MSSDKIDLQQIRKSVLRSQLLALESQAQAIYYLGTEHRLGLDLGRNPEIYLVVQDVKDVAASARTIVDEARTVKAEEMTQRLTALQTLAHDVVKRTEEACRHAEVEADQRLEDNLADNLDKDENPSELPEVPTDVKHLKARAGIACHCAETDQHLTFKLQVRAICDLALELAFNAAAEAGLEYPRDSSYWLFS